MQQYLWLLTQNSVWGYDVCNRCVVIAASEEEAKKIHPNGEDALPFIVVPGQWGTHYTDWASETSEVTAICIGTANSDIPNKGNVVCASFSAG